MSSFRDELSNTIVNKEDFLTEIQEKFDQCADTIIVNSAIKTYDKIKNRIIDKSKSGQYVLVNGQKHINGKIAIDSWMSEHCVFSDSQIQLLKSMGGKAILTRRFLEKYPDICLNIYDTDYGVSYNLGYAFVRTVKKNKHIFSDSYYYYFYLTDAFKKFIEELKKISLDDGVSVDFLCFQVEDIKIPNGGNNKHSRHPHFNSDVKVIVEYSIDF